MHKLYCGLLVGTALSMTGAAPAFSQQYATDPDPFVYSRLGQEHAALSHTNAVLPRTHIRAPRTVAIDARYATDPDPFIYGRLGQEHMALSHMDAVLPQTAIPVRPAVSRRTVFVTAPFGTDPDPRIRNRLRTETNVN